MPTTRLTRKLLPPQNPTWWRLPLRQSAASAARIFPGARGVTGWVPPLGARAAHKLASAAASPRKSPSLDWLVMPPPPPTALADRAAVDAGPDSLFCVAGLGAEKDAAS